jgi:hypothetical protein
MTKDGGPSPVITSLSWMPSRRALLLRDSSFAKRFLRSSRGSGRTSCPPRQRRDGIANAVEGVAVVRSGAGPQAHPLVILAGDHPVSVELISCSQPGPDGSLSASAGGKAR